jgi:hypothetical protein
LQKVLDSVNIKVSLQRGFDVFLLQLFSREKYNFVPSKAFTCLKSSIPLDLSHKNPRVKCPYFTEAIAASVNTDFFQEEKSWRKGRRF